MMMFDKPTEAQERAMQTAEQLAELKFCPITQRSCVGTACASAWRNYGDKYATFECKMTGMRSQGRVEGEN